MIGSAILTFACIGLMPLYDPSLDHPWNAVHRLFYAREFSNGAVYEHPAAFDPPWTTWSRFYGEAAFHDLALATLDRFLALPASDVEGQSAMRRAILLGDLWPVFDALAMPLKDRLEVQQSRQRALRERVARIMHRLELSEEEARGLPDNLHALQASQRYSSEFDAAEPEAFFLPRDLQDPEGPWVVFAPRKASIAAHDHVGQSQHRSSFVALARAAGDRSATLKMFATYSDRRAILDRLVLPNGSLRALWRRRVLPTREGGLIVTPITESLQLIVVTPESERPFKFVLDRANYLSGGIGLRPVERQETLDAWGFGNVLTHREPLRDTDGDQLALGRYAVTADRVGRAYDCAICHQGRRRFFANSAREGLPVEERSAVDQSQAILREKQASASWQLYRDLAK